MDTTTDHDTLRALEQAVPAGPWRVAESTPAWGIRTEGGWELVYASYPDSGPKILEFIAAMRNALPALLDELAEARRELDRLRATNGCPSCEVGSCDEAIHLSSSHIGELSQKVVTLMTERDAAREELAKTRAELKREQQRARMATQHARNCDAQVADADAEVARLKSWLADENAKWLRHQAEEHPVDAEANPATTAEAATVCVHTHCQLDQHETVNVADATTPITVTHGGPATEPATPKATFLPAINSAGVGEGNCNCQAIKGTPNYPGPWHPAGDTPSCPDAAPAAG